MNEVKWSPNGEKLITGSHDQTLKVIEFGTGKMIYYEKTPNSGNYILNLTYLLINTIADPAQSVCFFESAY